MSIQTKEKDKNTDQQSKTPKTPRYQMQHTLRTFYHTFCIHLFHFFGAVGALVSDFWCNIFRFLRQKLKRPLRKMQRKGNVHLQHTVKRSHHHFSRLHKELSSTLARGKALWAELREINSWKIRFSRLRQGLFNGKESLCKILNYVAPTVSVLLFIAFVHAVVSNHYVLAIEQNNQTIAYVDNSLVYERAIEQIEQQLVVSDSAATEYAQKGLETFDRIKPSFSLSKVNSTNQIADETTLTNTILENSSADIQPATGLYVDGTFYGATTNSSFLESELQSLLTSYSAQTQTSNPSFVNHVERREGIYVTASVKTNEDLTQILHSNKEEQQNYTIQEGDTLEGIASKSGTTVAQIKGLNANLNEEKLMPGQTLLLASSKPLLSLCGIRTLQYEQKVPYQELSQNDPNLTVGNSVVTQAGQTGKNLVTASIQVINGRDASQTILSSQPIQTPVPQITNVGTKSVSNTPISASRGTGSKIGMIRPLTSGYISCGYSASHQAIDIATPNGTPIHAAAAGRVTLANWFSTYGQCVIVDHGNGMQTLYAHMSKINVSVGQSVAQGDTLGLVGSTGYSTGNHLHFEVRVNGRKQDPRQYVTI